MEDFLGLIVVIAVVLLSASGSKKKKQKKQNRQRRRSAARFAAERERTDAGRYARDARAARGFAAAFEQQRMDCAAQPIHLHDADPQAMRAAGEGEDPCHAGGHNAYEQAAAPDAAASMDEQKQALAQDVLRGVVMSEILMRPADRMALRRGGRRA